MRPKNLSFALYTLFRALYVVSVRYRYFWIHFHRIYLHRLLGVDIFQKHFRMRKQTHTHTIHMHIHIHNSIATKIFHVTAYHFPIQIYHWIWMILRWQKADLIVAAQTSIDKVTTNTNSNTVYLEPHFGKPKRKSYIRWFFCCFFSTIIFPFYALFYISNNCAIVIVQLPRFTEESPLLFSYHSSSKLKLGIIYSFQLFSLHAIQAIFWALLLWFEFLGLLHSNKSVYESIARCFFWNFIKAIIYTIDQDCSPIPLLLSGNISPLILCDPRFFIQNKKTDQILFCGKTIPQSLMIVNRCGKVLYRRLSVCLFVWLSFIFQTKI